MEMFVMTLSKSLPTSQVPAFPARDRLQSVEQRLATAERELRTQFTRIAQLQAQLDQLLARRRRSSHRLTAMGNDRQTAALNGARR